MFTSTLKLRCNYARTKNHDKKSVQKKKRQLNPWKTGECIAVIPLAADTDRPSLSIHHARHVNYVGVGRITSMGGGGVKEGRRSNERGSFASP